MNSLSKKIEDLRNARNLDKEKISDLLGITRQGYDYALKHSSWTFSIIDKMSRLLKMPIDYFSSSYIKEGENIHSIHEGEYTEEKINIELNLLKNKISYLEQIIKIYTDTNKFLQSKINKLEKQISQQKMEVTNLEQKNVE